MLMHLRTFVGCFGLLLREQVVYRWEVLFRIVGALVYLVIHTAIWAALYQGRSIVADVVLGEMITYVVAVRMVRSVVEFELGSELETLVKTGDIMVWLARPVDYRLWMLWSHLAYAASSLVTRGLPIVVAGMLLFPLQQPASGGHLAGYAALLVGAFLLGATLNMLFAATALLHLEPKQFQWILMGLAAVASGAFVPLWFFPDWLRPIVELLPLRLMGFVQASMYLGRTDLSELPLLLLEQLAWSALFVGLTAIIWQRSRSRLAVYGG